jgi:hypothetical protein
VNTDRDERGALAVACSLTTPALRARRAEILAFIRAHLAERRDLPNGIGLRFAPEAPLLARVAELMEAERQCCPFLELRLTVAPGGGPVWLELTGPEGTRDFLTRELGL